MTTQVTVQVGSTPCPVVVPKDVNTIVGFDTYVATVSGCLTTNPNLTTTDLQTVSSNLVRTDILTFSRVGKLLNIPVISGETIFAVMSTAGTCLIIFDQL